MPKQENKATRIEQEIKNVKAFAITDISKNSGNEYVALELHIEMTNGKITKVMDFSRDETFFLALAYK